MPDRDFASIYNTPWEAGVRRAYRAVVVCPEEKASNGCYVSCGPVTGGNGWPAVDGPCGVGTENLKKLATRIADCVNACSGFENPQDLRDQRDALLRAVDWAITMLEDGRSSTPEALDVLKTGAAACHAADPTEQGA